MTKKFQEGDKVKVVFSKERHPDVGSYKTGADDKEYEGTIHMVQENGNLTIDFKQNGVERQISVPSSAATFVSRDEDEK